MIDPAGQKLIDELLSIIAGAKSAKGSGKPFIYLLGGAAAKMQKFAEDVQSGVIQGSPELDAIAEKMLKDLTSLAQAARSTQISRFRLEDVEARAKEAPEHFLIPDLSQRMNLKPRDFVKLIFLEGPTGGERMWVQVDGSYGDGSYIGTLKNQPVTIGSIEMGEQVKFSSANVADIQKAGRSWD
jgi:uncharacterized protein YegJ (DUF2314 family)